MKNKADSLRLQAEKLLHNKPVKNSAQFSEAEINKLNHELEVHQIELELQNAELTHAKYQVEQDAEKYSEFYDFAPTGYFSLSHEGKITEMNLTGAQMLQKERMALKNTPFDLYLSTDTRAVFHLFLNKAFKTIAKESCVVSLDTKSNLPAYVLLTGIVHKKGNCCLVTATDITSRIQQEEENRRIRFELTERLKELNCHNRISEFMSNSSLSVDEVCEKIVQSIPPGWQFPDITEAFIQIRDKVYQTGNYKSGQHFMDKEIKIRGQVIGYVEVCIPDDKLPAAAQLFLPEESGLLLFITEQLGRFIEKKESDQILFESEEKYSKVFKTSPFAIIISRASDGGIIDVNESFSAISGYTRKESINNSTIKLDLWANPENRDKVVAALAEGKEIFGEEHLFRTKTGEIRTGIFSAQIVQIQNETYVLSSINDITGRKQAEKALKDSEALYRGILNASPDDITITDLEGHILMASPSAWKMFGYESVDEIMGRSIGEFIVPADRERALAEMARMQQGIVTGMGEYLAVRPDGSIFDVEVNGGVIRNSDGIPTRMVFIVRDISEREKAEQQLRFSEEKYRNIFESLRDVYYEASIDGTLLELSPSVDIISKGQYSRSDLIGKSFLGLYADPCARDLFFAELFSSGHLNDYELLLRNKDGSVVPVSISSVLLVDNDNKPVKISGTIRDITDRKAAEELLTAKTSLLTNLITNMEEGILLEDQDRKILLTNQMFCKMFGIPAPPEAMVGADCSQSAEQSKQMFLDPARFIADLDNILAEKKLVLDDELELADGRCFVRDYIPTYHNKEYSGHLWKYRDITDRKQSGNRLSESEEKFRTITEQTGDLIAITDPSGVITYASPASASLFHISPEEMCGTHFSKFLAEPADSEALAKFRMALARDEITKNLEMHMKRKDGSVFTGELNGSRFHTGTQQGTLVIIRDITERKLAENELRKFRTISDQATHGTAISNMDGMYTYANDAFLQMHGWKREELLGKSIMIIHNEEQFPRAEELLVLLKSRGGFTYEEVFHTRKDGTTFPTLMSAKVVYDENTLAQFLSTTTIDITEKKAAEEDILKLSKAVEQSPVSIIITSLDGIIQYANAKACETSGYTYNELVGNNPRVLHSGEMSSQSYEQMWQTIINGKEWKGTFQNKKKNGELFWSAASISPITDSEGKTTHYLSVQEDITSRKLVESQLQMSEEKYRTIFESVQDVYFEAAIDGTLLEISPSIEIITKGQYCRKNLIGQPFSGIYASPEERSIYYSKLFEQKRVIDYELSLRNKDGSIIPVTVSSALSFDAAGKPEKIIGILRDISERKKAEEKVLQSEAALNYSQEIARMGSWEFNAMTGKYTWSDNNYRLVGLRPGETEVTIDLFKNMVYAEDLPLLDAKVQEATVTKKAVSMDVRVVMPDGSMRWIQNNVVPVFEGETLLSIKGVNIDITDKKQAEAEILSLNANLETKIKARTLELLATNESLEKEVESRIKAEADLAVEKQRLAFIIEGTNVGTWEWNIQTGETVFNERWAGILGNTLEEISPSNIETWMKFAHPEDLKISGELLEKHFKGESVYYACEARMKHRNGDWVWVLDRGKVHTWDDEGKPLLMSGTHQDITERKLAEHELKQVSARLALATKAGGVGVWDYDIDNNILVWDDQMFSLYGIEKKDFSGAYDAWQSGLHPDDKERGDAEIQMAIRGEKEFDTEFRVVWPDGSVRDIRALAIVQHDSSGKPLNLIGTNWDITVKKQAEALLNQTRRNYETFFNTIDDFLFVLNEQGNIIHTNETVTRRLGYTAEELMGESVLMVHPAERREEAGRIVGEMLAGTSEFCPVPLVTKAGKYLSVETRVKPGFWDGNPVIFGVTKDISKIKLSEEKFSKAFQLNATLMAISTLDGVFIEVNDTFLKTLGYNRREVIGNTSSELSLFEANGLRDLITDKLKQNIPVREVELNVRTKSGEFRSGIFSADTIYIGKDLCLLTMMVDITERKRSEEALKQSEARFSSFMDYLPAVVFLKDHEGRTLFVNRYMEDAFGASAWIGKTMQEVFPDELGEKLRSDDIDSMQLGYHKIEESMLHLDGKMHQYETQKFTIDRLGKEPWLGGISQDITERKRAEGEIIKSREEAEKANRAKSEFLSRMSHELRTPMNSILGFAQLLNMGELNPKQKKSVGHILTSGKHLLVLIDEVLDISRIESGRLVCAPEPIMVNGIIHEMMDTVQPLADARNLKLATGNSPDNELFVMSDRKLLKQVLINLLNNAVKYNRPGGSIFIKTETLPPDDAGFVSARISVTDSGLGIPPENIPKIFVPFERIGAERTQTEGTGLGLAVVKKLMEAMEGAVGVESIVGEGSTFWIELPVAENHISWKNQHENNVKLTADLQIANKQIAYQNEEKADRAAELVIANKELAYQNEEKAKRASELLVLKKKYSYGTGTNVPSKNGTILYIEDNIQNAELVEEIIRNYRPGIQLITSEYGNTAVKLAAENLPDLILLDLDLPDMDGSTVLANLLADDLTKNIPVVILTADATQHQIEKLLAAGATEYLTKPLDINVLIMTVDDLIVQAK